MQLLVGFEPNERPTSHLDALGATSRSASGNEVQGDASSLSRMATIRVGSNGPMTSRTTVPASPMK